MGGRMNSMLDDILEELDGIIRDLDDVADDIKKNFINIGNEQCAECVRSVANKYRRLKRKIAAIDIRE